ncbi:ATP-binding protein [Nonomuraea polychroma]|uniref:ATP-binding protein n=1 Tax=Nonomuraea polychroma TaxID=46176 RepID=UPI003D8BBE4D
MDQDVLIGRDRELADFTRLLEAARAGSGALVLVEGVAGVGKTALAHALVRRAREAGMRVAWGACLEGEGAAPYWPWVQILRAVGVSAAQLVDPVDGAAGNRFQLFDGVVEVLRSASAEHGLVLVLDDLHWADVPSLRLLHWVASTVADSAMLVVGLYRGREIASYADAAAVFETGLQAMRRERATTQIVLGGLAPGEITELATRTFRRRMDDVLLRAVRERCEGNPFFVLELLRLAGASGHVEGGVPSGIREVIGRRLARLAPAARQTMRQASVLGREFSAGLLGAMLEQTPAQLLDILDEAISAELVQVVDGHVVRFEHVLTQEVLYTELPTTDRQRLHARAAAALRATGAADGAIESLAHHLRQAAPLGGAEDALDVTSQAAARARGQLAYEHAAVQYRQALGLLGLVPGGVARRADLLLELSRCEFRSGAVEDAWRSCREAADLGRAAGDGTTVADAATVLRGITNSPITPQVHAMCREALVMLGEADPVRQARLLAQLAVTADPFSSATESGLGRRALRAAEATGDPDARFLALQARQAELVDGAHVLERLSIGERAVGLGRETGLDEYTAWGHAWRIDAFWELGRRIQLDAEMAAFAGVVAHLGEPLWVWRLRMTQATLAMFEGRYEHARGLAEEGLAIGRRGGHDGADFIHLVFTSHLALETGTGMDTVEAGVRRFVEQGPFLARSWHALVLAGVGRLNEAARLWETLIPHLSSVPRRAAEWIVVAIGHAQLSVRFQDHAVAAAVYADLLPYADRQVTGGAHTPCEGPVALYLGMLATLLEDWEAAEAHLRTALAASTAMGSAPYEAMTHLHTARLRLARRPAADLHAAVEHLDVAERTARRLGMAPLEAEIVRLRDAGRRTQSALLSPREEQVAGLVAEGLTNRQIARRLHLSERTAENHVAHILTKLGFDSRARIAAWYAARNLPG